MPPRLDIIVPAYNEEENLPALVARIVKAFRSTKISYRVLIVDDRSNDNTAKVVSQLASKHPVCLLSKSGRQGKAYCVLEAARSSQAPYLAMIDADLQYPPEALPRMYEVLTTSNSGVVVANRLQSFLGIRGFLSRANRHVFGRTLGLNCDVQSGLKMFRHDIVTHIVESDVTPWTIDVPLLHTAKELGYPISTVDINFNSRRSGKSNVNVLRTAHEIGTGAIKVRLSPAKVYSIQSSTLLHAGVIYKKNKFITHSHLPHHLSALTTFTLWQKLGLSTILALLAAGMFTSPLLTAQIFIGVLSLVYFIDVVINIVLVFRSLRFPPEISISTDQLQNCATDKLPIYSILCPLYREAKVLPHFIESISALDWPKNKLDVLLLLEEDDTETISAAKSLNLPSFYRTLVVPHSQPKTKPKACNFGLVHARGEYVVIYDAEDRPDSDQLKKAFFGFQKVSVNTICLQAKLNYYNPHQNFLTRLFTTEYSLWFDVALPGLQTINTSIPLGGTSNHFKTAALRRLHGWDAFNVTEDCDLGTRLFKSGYQTAIIDSLTLEEANSHLGNWLRQRSRWIKGYLQTFLVHNRQPLRFLKDHGLHGLLFQLNTGGKIAFMIINPILWTTTFSYFAFYPVVGPTIEALYPPLVLYLAASSFIFGNFLYLYYYMIGCARRGHWELIKYVFLIPVYWLFISLAALKAVFQLIFRPHYWEKTHHGLHISPARTLKVEGLLLIASSMVSNVLNFLYNVYLGRHLTSENFSLIGLMGSFLYLVQIPGSALGKTVSHQSAYLSGQLHAETHRFWRFVRSKSLFIFFFLSILWIVASPLLVKLFRADSIWPLVIFSPVWLTAVLASIDRGLLSGHRRFGALALLSVVEAALKFASAVIFIGFNQPQYVFASFPLTSILSFIIIWLVARPKSAPPSDLSPQQFPWKFFSTSIISRLSTLAFLSLDVILAKIYLPPEIAGQYVLVSLSGKIIYFLGSLFDPFIIPVVSRSQGEGKSPRRPFYQLFLGNAACSLIGFIALGPMGHAFAPLLFGEKIVPLVPYLTIFSLAMVNFTLGGSVVSYHLARREYAFPTMAFFVSLSQPILFYFFHSSLWSLTHVMLWLSVAYALTLFSMHLVVHYYVPISGNLNDLYGLFARLFFPRRPSPSDKLRILIFNWRDVRHKWAGGAEVYIHELAKRWVSNGHQVTVFCGNDSACPTHENIAGVEIIRHGGFFTVYFWAALYYLLKLRGRFDLVIDSENGIPFFTPLFVSVPKVLLIHHIHQDVFRRQLPFPLAQAAQFLESKIMPLVYHGQKIITVSESSKKDILKVCRCRPENISVVTPGINPAQFSKLAPKTQHPSFLYLGRIRPYKNLDVAITAFAEVVKTYPKAKFNIAGGGEGVKQLRNLTEKLKITHYVYFLGPVSEKEKVQLLSQSWVMLQPSSFEGWGITVIEANACATPVIASDVVGLRDSVVHQETGILVPPQDPAALASAIKYLIRHPARLRIFSQNSLAWSVNFNWKDQSRKFLDATTNYLAIKYSHPVISQPALAEQPA